MRLGIAIKVVAVLLSLALQAKAGGGDADTAAHEWCKKTEMNDLCASIVDADPRSELKKTPNGLCVILRDRAAAETHAAATAISSVYLKNTTNFNHYAVQCLQDCQDDYDSTIYNLEKLDFSVINSTTYTEMSLRIGAAYIGARSCEERFTERPGTTPSPLTAQNQAIKNVSSLLGSVLDLVVCNRIEPPCY